MAFRRCHPLLCITLAIIFKPAKGFFGYDCGQQLSNLTTISLLGVSECDIKPPEVNVTTTYGQLLQLNEFGLVHTYKCSIKITRFITRCSMFSHASRVFGGELSYYSDVSRDQCYLLHQTGFLNIHGTQIMGIKGNSTTQKSVIFAGNSGHDGSCEGSTFSDSYGNYKNVYVAGYVEIKIQDSYRPVRLSSNRIKLSSGVTCIFSEQTCTDDDAGTVFWSTLPEDSCGLHKYSLLYQGNIDKIYEIDNDKTMYSLETEDITFALWRKGQHKVCGYTVQATEHPKLFIVENAHESGFLNKEPTATANLDLFTYMNSKFLYTEKHVRKQLNLMYYDILRSKCELERQIMSNALALAAISPEEVAYRIMGGPGYLAVTAGEVIHLVKCLMVEVKRRETKECYEQLPIYRDKEEYFLAPRTHILLRTGKQIPCDKNLPPMYQLHNIWFKMLPEAIESKNPETLKPQTKPTWKYVSPESLAVSGVYSQNDQNRLRDMILFPIERPSVLNKVALGISGRYINPEEMRLEKLLNPETISAIASSTWNKMWANFLTFGTASAAFIGAIMICRLIKLIMDTIIHGYAIYSLYGFSIHLLGAIWNSVTQLLIHLGHQKNRETPGDNAKAIERKETNEKEKQGKGSRRKLEDPAENDYIEIVPIQNRLYPDLRNTNDRASV